MLLHACRGFVAASDGGVDESDIRRRPSAFSVWEVIETLGLEGDRVCVKPGGSRNDLEEGDVVAADTSLTKDLDIFASVVSLSLGPPSIASSSPSESVPPLPA